MQPAFARPVQRQSPRPRATAASEPARAPRVTVAWTPANDVAPTEVVLVADRGPSATGIWTWHERFSANWVEAISSARCTEVVLTARIGNDAPGKHLVLDLAEQLTLTLTETHPLIRVRFLPALDEQHDA